ncbi:hypothetical protein NB689_001519 [Xanthomonas sacchari]|nr:hypothetical protein [Xanthomonas sacchari]
MPGVAVQLRGAGAEGGVDVVGEPAHDVEQGAFAGGLEVGHAGLDHVPGAVQLVALGQVGPAFLRRLHREVGVEVAVGLLRGPDQLDGGVGVALQRRIGMLCEQVGHRFQPFGHVAVLEHHAVERAVAAAGGDAEVLDGMAGFGIGDVVVERVPLVGQHHLLHQALVALPERIGDAQVGERQFRGRHGRMRHGAEILESGEGQCTGRAARSAAIFASSGRRSRQRSITAASSRCRPAGTRVSSRVMACSEAGLCCAAPAR